jgi:hypothetical protein
MSDTIDKLAHYRIVEQANRLKEKFDVRPLEKGHKDIIDDNNKTKRWADRYLVIKRNLEACREAKALPCEATDSGPAKHWEIMRDQIANKITNTKQRLQDITNQLTLQISTHESNLKSVEAKLQAAIERSRHNRKTKEELRLEKELQQLAIDFKKTNPDKNIDFYMPGYHSLLGTQPPMNTVVAAPVNTVVAAPAPAPVPVVEAVEDVEPEEEIDFASLTPWQRWVKGNPGLSQYKLYMTAIQNGITPEIEKPAEPAPKRRPNPKKTATETISRDALSKVLPNYQ